jgi:hypothetical protein
MNAKLVNAAAAVIVRSMENGRKTPAGWAMGLESAGLLRSPELFLALYDGVEPELFTTVEAAREYCDDIAPVDAHGKCWDWTVNEYGVHVQFWTHPDDDRPLSETSGTVTPVVVQGVEPLPGLAAEVAVASDAVGLAERAVAELRREHEENARLRDALRDATDQIAGLESELGGATAEVAALNARLHDAAMARTWRLENGKKFVYAEDIAPALLGLEQKTSAVEADVSPQVEKLRGLLSGQRAAVEDPHDSPLHHDYRVGRDLPELGGATC